MKSKTLIPVYLNTKQDFKYWLIEYSDKMDSICLGFFNPEVGLPGISFEEALEEALCFGWVCGDQIEYDEISYMFQFAPRKKNSEWTQAHVEIMRKLIAEKRVEKAGMDKFDISLLNS